MRLFLLSLLTLLSTAHAQWINELHYDNTGTDVDEFIEVVLPVNTAPGTFTLALYNQSGGALYNTLSLPETPGQIIGGLAVYDVPASGLQNGPADGIALVNGTAVVQFLSYEGTLTATDGPAAGLTSTDIGVAEEPAPAAGTSLALAGNGIAYDSFQWQTGATPSRGQINPQQAFLVGDDLPTVRFSVRADTVAEGDAYDLLIVVAPASVPTAGTLTVDLLGSGDLSFLVGFTGLATLDLSDIATGGQRVFPLQTADDAVVTGDRTVTFDVSNVQGGLLGVPATFDLRIEEDEVQAVTITLNEIHADPSTTEGDANGDGAIDPFDDEFLELVVDPGPSGANLAGYTIRDGNGIRHTFPANTVVTAPTVFVLFGGGRPVPIEGAVVDTASTGQLGLNNGGDTVTISDSRGVAVATYTYGSEGGNDQSLTRSPDLTGAFVLHTTVTAGLRFSPGRRADGSRFDFSTSAEPTRPDRRSLATLFPNPFSSHAVLEVAVPSPQRVRVAMYNVLGQHVATLLDARLDGLHRLPLDGRTLASGLYVVRVTGETFTHTARVTKVE